jgi:hypothetical protein
MVTPQRSNTGSLIGGGILIGLGLLFLLAQFFSFAAWQYIWPLVIVGVGAVFFAGMVAGGKGAGALAIPGSILSVIGLLLLFQNLTGHWETWSYGWTIIVMAVGVGLFIAGLWSGNGRQRAAGLRVATIGFVLFVLFGAFFEFVLGGFTRGRWQQAVFPVLLILTGLALVLRRSGLLPGWFNLPAEPAAPPARPPEPPQT